MSNQISRRQFVRTTVLTGAGIYVAQGAFGQPASPNDSLRFACIGVGGKGDSDTADAARFGKIAAICDIDDNTLADHAKKYPDAKVYTDYRKMLDEMSKEIDVVVVSTPDHSHGPAAAMAMGLGKHCYCQKPLAHSIYECRRLGEIAKQNKVATQMGNQGTGSDSLRKNAFAVRSGALGVVKEVHVWTNRPIWPQGMEAPAVSKCPDNVHWDLWIGPAAYRDYGDGIQPFNWRGYWDYGTGALGDMACHTVNLPFMALDLRNPTKITATSSGTNKVSYPKSSKIVFEFPAIKDRPAVTMTWYDGGNKPPTELLGDGMSYEGSGSLIVGDKGKLYTPGDYGDNGRIIGGVDVGEPKYPHSIGHWEEFIRAIKGGEPAMSNFPDYAGPLAENILLGNLAVWAGDNNTVEWDWKRMRAKGRPELQQLIKPAYRAGYTI